MGLGSIGATGLAIGGALAGAANTGEAPLWWSPPGPELSARRFLVFYLVLACAGLILLLRSWTRLRRRTMAGEGRFGLLAVVAVAWVVPFALAPPLASRDVYAYLAYGEMTVAGLDPYEAGPEVLVEAEVLSSIDPVYAESPSVYGPLFLLVSGAVARVSGGSVVVGVFLFRTLAVLGLVAAALASASVARSIGRDPNDAVLLGALNPLVLYHLVSGAHNEAIMLGFLTAGVAVGRRRVHLGIVLCALAGAIKLPGLLGAVFLAWPCAMAATSRKKQWLRLGLGGAETLAVLAVLSRASGSGWGWLAALAKARSVNAYLSLTQLFGSGVSLALGFDSESVLAVVRPLGLLTAVGFSLYVLARKVGDPVNTLGWSLMVFAVLHPTTQPWYFTWGLLLIAAATAGTRNRTLVALSAVACFFVPPVGPGLGLLLIDGPGYLATLVGVLLLLLFTASRGRVLPHRFRSGLPDEPAPAVVISRSDTDLEIIEMLDNHSSERLVCVMSEGSVWEAPIRSALISGSDVVIAPKNWNWIGRLVIRLAWLLFPRRLGGLDPLSSTYGMRLGEVDLNRLEPDGNALLLEVLVRNRSLSVVQLEDESTPEVLSWGNAARYLVHLGDLRLRGSFLWGGIAGARWRART